MVGEPRPPKDTAAIRAVIHNSMNKKVILMILDGWGKSPDPKVSAIDQAQVPFINSLYQKYPSAQLRTDGLNVGLPEGQMGNSEVGHMNLGAGRIVMQDLVRTKTDLIVAVCTPEAQSIKNTDIAEELALPPVKIHCSILAEDAMKAAIADYKQKKGL